MPIHGHWKGQNGLERVLGILSVLATLMLSATISVVDVQADEIEVAYQQQYEALASPAPSYHLGTGDVPGEGADGHVFDFNGMSLKPVWKRWLFLLHCAASPVFSAWGLGVWTVPLSPTPYAPTCGFISIITSIMLTFPATWHVTILIKVGLSLLLWCSQ